MSDAKVVNPVVGWPKDLFPKLRNKLVLTVELNFATPESWGKTAGGIILAPTAVEQKQFSFKIHEVVAISPTIHEDWSTDSQRDFNYAPDLKVGQWVVIVQSQDFIHLGQKFNMCAPQFIGAIIKEPEEDFESMFRKWDNLVQQRIKIVEAATQAAEVEAKIEGLNTGE